MALAALGKAGHWQIELDESVNHIGGKPPEWGLTLDNETVHLQILIADPSVISQMLDFLRAKKLSSGSWGEFRFGVWHGADAILLKEEGRLQFKFFSRANLEQKEFPELIQVSVLGEDMEDFIKAVENLVRDLGN